MNIGARNDAFFTLYDRITQGIASAFCAISAACPALRGYLPCFFQKPFDGTCLTLNRRLFLLDHSIQLLERGVQFFRVFAP